MQITVYRPKITRSGYCRGIDSKVRLCYKSVTKRITLIFYLFKK